MEPITRLLRKGTTFEWGDDQRSAWKKVCDALKKDPTLYCCSSEGCVLTITCDASQIAYGACLSMENEKKVKYPIAFVSRRTNEVEEKYSNTERELGAVVWALERLEYFINGNVITIETDHEPLLSIVNGDGKSVPTTRCLRMLKKLTPWLSRGLTIRHIKGASNPSDVLSRVESVSDASHVSILKSSACDDKVITMEDVRKCQQEDDETLHLRENVEINGGDSKNSLVIIDDILCFKSGGEEKRIRIFVPLSLRHEGIGSSTWC